MHRIFWGMAVIAWTLLLASVVWTTRLTIGLATLAALLVHTAACLALRRSAGRAAELVRAFGWPDWMAAQAEKNHRRVTIYWIWGGALLAAMTSVVGAWQIALASACFAYHLGAFASEGVLLATQTRLLREYESRSVSERSV